MTREEFNKQHAAELDVAFAAKYPAGRFTIQRWHYTGLFWVPRRPTSYYVPRGVGVVDAIWLNRQWHTPPNPILEHFQNCAFGKCTHYDNLADMIKAAIRFKVSEEMIQAFIAAYDTKDSV